jgi:UDP-N-acetylglucosamine--N-acetylmuramyl-(pentapeptide) pyrophosphoryl-undecaprenol N-acetylglucosamine transferase
VEVFICGGGTGGHFFSGVAVAEKFLNLNPTAKVLFVGTRYGIEARTKLSDPRMNISFVAARGVKGRGIISKIFALLMMMGGVFQSFGLLLRHRPKIVIGVGGYASAPTLFAALLLRPLMRWKVLVLEQNSYAGLANRLLAKLGARALAAFECKNFELVDLPLRHFYEERAKVKRKIEWPPKTILVMGGSQGAAGLNQQWTRLLVELKNWNPIHILHQTGVKDLEVMTRIYRDMRISAEVFSFTEDMPTYLDRADLLICRAGAMTVFEAILFEKPSIFIPFPKATDDHQKRNALSVQDSQWILDEIDFDWRHVFPLLQSSSPKVPHRSRAGLVSWNQLLKLS